MVDADLTSPAPTAQFNTVQVIDFPTLVSLGLITGSSSGSKVGSNTSIPASTFILLSNVTSAASPVNFPAAPQQMQIVSSSASDTAAGTGAQQVKLTYLRSPTSPAGFTVNTEFILTNGLTPVLTVNTDIYRVEKLEVSRAGAGLFAAGNVSLQSVGGATTFERIDAGQNINRTCIHFVPKGFKSTLFSVMIGASTAAGVIFIVEQSFPYQGNNIVTHGVNQLELGN